MGNEFRKMSDIRKITLYKNQYGSCNSEKDSHRFFTFGHFNGMDIDCINEEKSKYGDLDKIFNNRILGMTYKKLEYNFQTFYVFRDCTDQVCKFWENEENDIFNFFIVSFIHVSSKNLKAIEIREQLMEIMNKNSQSSISLVYSTFNDYDFAIFTQSNSYKPEVFCKKVESLHISYSFSILSIKFKLLSNDVFIKNRYDNELHKVAIDTRFTLKSIKELNEWMTIVTKDTKISKEIKEQIKSTKTILYGCYDVEFKLLNITLYDYLLLICYQNINFSKYFFSMSCDLKIPYLTKIDRSINASEISIGWVKDTQKMLELLYDLNRSASFSLSQKECVYAMKKILHNLHQVENDNISNCAFYNISYPLKMYVERLRGIIANDEISEFTNRDLYFVLESINKILEDSSTSDVYLLREPNNFTPIYDIPGKLLTFYSGLAFFLMYLLRGFDENPKYHYAYLINVQLQYQMSVEIVFEQQEPCDRLMLVHMPIYHLYNPKNLLLSLVHEVAHAVGEDARQRKSRNEQIYILISNYCTHFFLDDIFDLFEFKLNEKDDIFKYTEKIILDELLNVYKNVVLQKNSSSNNYFYMKYFEVDMKKALGIFFNEYMIKFVKYLSDYIYKLLIKKNNLEILRNGETVQKRFDVMHTVDRIITILNFKTKDIISSSSEYNVINKLDEYIYYFSETYADLVAIRTLSPPIEDYINNFSYNVQGKKDLLLDDLSLLLRISVMYELFYKNNNLEKVIESNDMVAKILDKVKEILDFSNVISKNSVNVSLLYKELKKYIEGCDKMLENKALKSEIVGSFKHIYTQLSNHANNDSSLDNLYEIVDNINLKYKAYNKASLLYFVECNNNMIKAFSDHYILSISKEEKEFIRYVPINGYCYMIIQNDHDNEVQKVFIEDMNYSEEDMREIIYSTVEICNSNMKKEILEMVKLQKELDSSDFEILDK